MNRQSLNDAAMFLFKSEKRIAFEWCTGLGKSKVAIDGIKVCSILEKKQLRVLLVVAETAHKQNWRDEMKKWNLTGESVLDIKIECYASLKNYKDTEWDIVIFDEAHHLGSDLRMDVLNDITSERYFFLSATMPSDLLRAIESRIGHISVSRIDLNTAVENHLLPKPYIYTIGMELSDKPNAAKTEISWGMKSLRHKKECGYEEAKVFMNNHKLCPNCTLKITASERQCYRLLSFDVSSKRTYLETNPSEFMRNSYLFACMKRKKFLGTCKTDRMKSELKKIEGNRYICFCSDIKQAQTLGKDCSIHSKKKDPLEILNKFNNKEINKLFAVGMLQEGQNLKDIEMGVMIQLDGKERLFIQKLGRILRSENPVVFIYYFKGTRDWDYLCNLKENTLDKSYFKDI